jgi:hypothetical protein
MPFFDAYHKSIDVVDGHSTTSFAGMDDFRSVPILNNNNLQYYSEIEVGGAAGASTHTGQKFNVILDTGSDKLWVPSTHCTSAVCKAHHRFDASLSETFKPSHDSIRLSYGTGSVHARTGHDHVKLGNENVESYPIALAESQTQRPFSSLSKIDGIFGIGHGTKFTQDKPLYSFYLSNDTAKPGNMTIGGMDIKHVDESAQMHTHPVTDPNSWSIDLVDIKVGDERIGLCPDGACKALIDTGSSLITGPPSDFSKLITAGVHKTCNGYGHSPSPPVTLIFKDANGAEVEYPLTSKEYSIDFQDDHKECKLGFGPLNMGNQKWVIGDTFLRRYVSVFDKNNHQISFVRSQHDNENIGVLTREFPPAVFLPAVGVTSRRKNIIAIGCEFLFN